MSALDIINLIKNPSPEDITLIEKAYHFAEEAHKDQKRYSGEPHFVHLYETAKNLAELGMDTDTIAAGFLHDSLEDTKVSAQEIQKEFGSEILFLVEGVTKLGKIKFRNSTQHNESMRKLFIAMSEDLRVLIIRLADRLHNMQTLQHVPEKKQKRIAAETLEILAPLAYRFGMRKLSRELEDLAFPYVLTEEYKKIKGITKQKKAESIDRLEKFYKSVRKALAEDNIDVVKTEYRVKSLFSLHKKILKKKGDMEKIFDFIALRIIVKDVSDCYRVLGIVHGTWRPLPGRIKDYIAFPKPNGYRSLHTTIFTGDGSIVEVQIKTEEMHNEAEFGIASHLSYKDGTGKKIRWVKDIVHNPAITSTKFVNLLKSDFLKERIFVFTPKGDVIDLPCDSSPIDFAYSVHSDIGDHMSGVKVNGKMSSLNKPLKNGDIVEIITKNSAHPTQKWIDFCKTTLAKRHIRTLLNINEKK
ncbi:bifunctional (p)ppGpp synthetase/guanosine-3',5'-bis(diphosphate) 3'-pyrophosphohydrolase [Patescibacteria group bacterium]|nr:bifunctional (p)ppGpp synthetase/guanosine-3',5'-bis(diphosphate) 3'-pyrophosphohydrolase [Patescibacteria group bacterium]